MKIEPVDESAVFEKKAAKSVTVAEPPQSDPAAEKKAKLREHLAKCREKSLAVRKAKAEVKRANKRPVGRPRKNPLPPPAPEPTPEPAIPEPSVEPAVQRVAKPPPQPAAPGVDYDRLAGLVAARLRPPAAAPKPAPAAAAAQSVPNANDMTAFLNAYGNTVRENERAKLKAERDAKQKANLAQQTQRYFSTLPKTTSGDPWADLFNPR